jgi:rubredoxin
MQICPECGWVKKGEHWTPPTPGSEMFAEYAEHKLCPRCKANDMIRQAESDTQETTAAPLLQNR